MQGDQKNKPLFTHSGPSDFPIKRNDSFFSKMTIFGGNGFFERAPSTQQRDNANSNEQAVLVPIQQTHGNVFKGFRESEPQKISEPKSNQAQNYQRQCLEYEKYLFDSRIKMIIKRMAIKAYNLFKIEKQSQFFIFPIQRLLVTIAKKLLLNRFELFFLQYTFEMTKWQYDIQCIRKHATSFKSYIMLPDSQTGNNDIKLMQVYILYCAYFSKKSLNQLQSDNMFFIFCQDYCPRFKDYFPEWTQTSGITARINPKQLNSIFKKLTYNLERDHQDFQNYCLVVQQIIDISPAYNADKSGKQKKPKKSKKEPKNKQEYMHQNMEQKDYDNLRLPEIVQQDQSLDIEPLVMKQKKSSVLSVDLLEPGHYLTRSASQHER